MNKIIALYENITDAELKEVIGEIKESEITGSIANGTLRKYIEKVSEINGMSYSENLFGVSVSLLKIAAYRWFEIVSL